jgi:hypothetical protein
VNVTASHSPLGHYPIEGSAENYLDLGLHAIGLHALFNESAKLLPSVEVRIDGKTVHSKPFDYTVAENGEKLRNLLSVCLKCPEGLQPR